MLKRSIQWLLVCGVVAGSGLVWAASQSPVGLWKTIDDNTGKPKSEVRIQEKDGVYTGVVVKILDPKKLDAVCDKCTDDRKDKPVKGLQVIRGVKKMAIIGMVEPSLILKTARSIRLN